ncbi:hypothetical protein DAEQUDRAFT_753706 [Daedalea quercina L-15889]|uniref:Uncharacterized protein n=1 Tax=Daedalea quercina L-15889 TaxID=1314783 RepID=A0A165UL74_9APHY|nr:hypothetical protein DAEQUDRAFT_753706 [Daedalea quercina L-15889]
MSRTGPMMYVYNHVEDLENHPHAVADPDVLDFMGHEADYLDRNHPLRGSMSSPPPPYEPISYSLPSPLPSPSFPVHPPTTATIADVQLRPVPPHFLHDRAFSPDPRDNPHFIMTADERFHVAPAPPPREPVSLRQIPPVLQAGRPPLSQPSIQYRRSHSSPYAPSHPPVPPNEYRPVPHPQTGPPAPLMSQRMISASSMFPHHAVWQPPVSYASSAESGSSASSHSSSLHHTPGASPPSSTDSSPRNSSAPTTPSVSSANLLREDNPPPVPAVPAPADTPVTVPAPPPRVHPPPRTSSYGLPLPRTPAQAPVPILGANANLPSATTARPSQPAHNQSAPELHARPPPPSTLARSATAPTQSAPVPTASQSQGLDRSQTQDYRGERQQRGRSREQQHDQAVKRQRSRRPSITAPRDLDRIDELDETDPRGLAWHHESPYELATRTLSHRRKDGQESDEHANGNAASRNGSRERPHPKKKPSTTFSVEPGQIFPSGALYHAMQAPYRPQAPMAASYPPPFDPYGRDQLAYTPGAPSLPPTTPAPTDNGKLRKTPSRSQPVSQVSPQGSHHQQPGLSRPHPGFAPRPTPATQSPEPPTAAAQPPLQPSEPVRPMLQQRPSQRSHVRFESPSRPDVRPPLDQGSVDEAYDGIEPGPPPPPPFAHNVSPAQRPPPPSEALPPPPPQKPQSRPTSMYMAAARNESALQRPDLPLPPRRSAPSVQTQGSLQPRHVPKQLVMPTPLQPLEEQRQAEAARLAQQHKANAMSQGRRSEEGPVRHADIHNHGGRHMLHHSMSHRQSPVGQVQERAELARAASQGQNRMPSMPISAGPKVLRKRSVNNASTPVVGPGIAPSNATAAMFAARVVDDNRNRKTIERVTSGVWTRDPVKEAEIQRELAREPKVGRKLSKLARKLR